MALNAYARAAAFEDTEGVMHDVNAFIAVLSKITKAAETRERAALAALQNETESGTRA